MTPQPQDCRVTCQACRQFRAGWCVAAKRAGLSAKAERIEIGPQLASLPQHCPAFSSKGAKA